MGSNAPPAGALGDWARAAVDGATPTAVADIPAIAARRMKSRLLIRPASSSATRLWAASLRPGRVTWSTTVPPPQDDPSAGAAPARGERNAPRSGLSTIDCVMPTPRREVLELVQRARPGSAHRMAGANRT